MGVLFINKNHSIFLLLVCIIGIFLITSVSATDLNQTDTIQIDDNDLNLEMNGIDSSDEGYDTIAATDESGCSTEQLKTDENDALREGSKTINVTTKTFSGINDAINSANDGDTILLDGAYKQEASSGSWSQIQLNSITINKQINFVGINNAAFEGIFPDLGKYGYLSNYNNFIKINTNGVTFKDITFKYSKGLPAISSNYDFFIENCTFTNNNEYQENHNLWKCDGAAIYLDNCANVYINNSKFISNSGSYGGAIYIKESSQCNIINCYFEGNSAEYGGAIHMDYSSDIFIDNCSFINNHVTTNGGAIDAYEMNNLKVSGCNFTNCYSDGTYAGAIATGNCNGINISGCNFDSCHASRGGAVRLDTTNNFNIEDCNFIKNSASEYAGAIFIVKYGQGTSSYNGVINNCNFSDNHATDYGGAIDARQQTNLTVSGCNFNNCYCENEAGAIFAKNVTNMNVTGCLFDSCHSKTFSGAITFEAAINAYVLSSEFKNCSSTTNGAISMHTGTIDGVTYPSINLTIAKSNFTGNFATDVGCIGVGGSKGLKVIGCYFENNTVLGSSGCIESNNFSNIEISDSIFNNCKAGKRGAAMRLYSTNGILINNCEFNNCSSNNKGGALVFGISSEVIVNNSNFTNNHCFEKGGAIMIFTSDINITHSNFINDTSSDSFGAILAKNDEAGPSNVKIDNCLFEKCTDSNNGDSIGSESDVTYDIYDNIFDVTPKDINYYYTTILEVNDNMSVVKDDTVILTAKLRYLLGSLSYKPVTFRIYHENKMIKEIPNVSTDKNGFIELDVTEYLSDLGEYTINASFAGKDNINPVSNVSKVSVNSYIGLLTVNYTGKYYGDTSLNIKLINSRTNNPIPYAPIKVVFSNGKTASFDTDDNGLYTYNLPESFTPGSYNATIYVDRSNVDVKAVELNNIVINELNGEIEITQVSGSRILSIKLYNKTTGDVFKNVGLSLEFSPNRAYVDHLTTNDNGIVTYRMGFDVGTYSVIAKVTGNYRHFEITELKNIVINSDSGSADEFPSVITFGGPISFDYLKTGSTTFSAVYCSISPDNISVVGHPEIKPKIVGNRITVSGLDVGTYTLRVVTTPNSGYYSVIGLVNITVTKVSAVIKASGWSDYSKSAKVWTIKLYDSKTKAALKNMQVILKVYNGNKLEKTLKYNTNSKGEISIKPGSWSVGTHRVVINFSKYGYDCNPVTANVKVLKTTKLTFIVRSAPDTDGTSVSIWVKVGKKPIQNGVKILLYVKNGKKYKIIPLITGVYKTAKNKVYKGFVGYGTNLYSAGYHKIIVKPASLKYTGIKNDKFYIKKGANKGAKSETIISKGKEKYIYYRSK